MTPKHTAAAFILTLILPGASGASAETTVAPFDSLELSRIASSVALGGTLRVEGLDLGTTKRTDALELERFDVFTRDARVVVHDEYGEAQLPVPRNAYFRGKIAGEENSVAFLTVLERGEVRGLVSKMGEYWIVAGNGGSYENGGTEKLASPMTQIRRIEPGVELVNKSSSFNCGSDDLAMPTQVMTSSGGGGGFKVGGEGALPGALTTPLPEKAVNHTARVAIETDYEYLQLFGGNATAATDYIGDLFAYASGIYADEVGTNLLVSSIDFWNTTNDPWNQTDPLCALYQFGKYWNDNNAGNTRTIAHFLSGKNVNSGIAWLGVLCQGGFNVSHGGGCPGIGPDVSNYGGGYGFTGGIDGNFNINNPGIVWDIEAVSHEIGHNFNSPHTHCYGGLEGNASPVDQCYSGQCGSSGCFCGTPTLPCGQTGAGCGTIMSYCHLLFAGGLSNIAMTFGAGHPYGVAPDRVPTRMANHVSSRAAAYPGCLDYQAAPADPTMIFNDDFESGNLTKW